MNPIQMLRCLANKVRELAAIIESLVIINDLDARLREITSAEGYELTPIGRDADSVITTATVHWPDGSGGVFTTTTKNNTWLTVDAYTITYTGTPAKTVTQPLVTRDANGAVITKPLLVIT